MAQIAAWHEQVFFDKNQAVLAAERRDHAGRVIGGAKGQRGKVQPGDPTFGACDEGRGVGIVEGDTAGSAQEVGSVSLPEAQLRLTHLSEEATAAQSAAFLRAYLRTIGQEPIVPPMQEQRVVLLDDLLIEKVIQQLDDDLRDRPERLPTVLHHLALVLAMERSGRVNIAE